MKKQNRVGIILSGCGFLDGSEIHESVITLLVLDKAKVKVSFFAPDKKQMHVINHLTEEITLEQRNILIESARISRGNINSLTKANPYELDALIIPGGFGVIKNLSTFLIEEENCSIDLSLKKLIMDMHKLKKPIGLICIAPIILPNILKENLKITIGNNLDLSNKIHTMKSKHVICEVNDIVVDIKNKIVTTPAYMINDSISKIYEGIEKLVSKVLLLIE